MKWKVTYRGESGVRSSMICDADSRQELFKMLSQRHLTAIRIEENARQEGTRLSPKIHRIALLGAAIAVSVGIVAYFAFSTKDVRNEAAPPAKKSVKPIEVKHRKPIVREVAPSVQKEVPAKKEVVTNFVNNVWHDEKGRPHYKVARVIRPGQNTIINGKPWKPEKPVFHHASEVELDVLLSRKPGERIFGDVNWRAFERDLPLALADKVEILPDDTPEIIERKQAVMAAKRELVDAIKAGENPKEILKASRDEVNRLADIRDGLLSTVAELKREGASEQDIEDAVEAANIMLKEYNIDKPLISPKTLRERAQAAKLRKHQNQKGTQK